MRKRLIYVVSLLVILVLVFVGCSPAAKTDQSSGEASKPASESASKPKIPKHPNQKKRKNG